MRRLKHDGFNDWILRIIDDYSHRVEAYCGGAGSGKSHGALQKILLKAINSRRKVLIVRKVGTTLKHSVFALMRELLDESGELTSSRINRSDYEIELANGSTFIFKGLDDEQKIKSIANITDIVIEEATELTLDDFMQLNLRLRPVEPDPQIILMFNPVSKANWVYQHFFINPPPNVLLVNTSYHDNRFIPDDYKAELERLKETNPAYWRIYALGEFATLDKLVFPIVTKRIVSAQETTGLPFWCGLDFGYVNDPSALTWGFYDRKERRIYTTGEYHKKGMTNADILKAVKDLGLMKERIIADSAEPKSIDELHREGVRILPAQKGRDSVMHGIDFMLRHDIIIDERCVHTAEEYDNYTWMKDRQTGEYYNCPVDGFNHHIDGTRYALEQYRKPERVPLTELYQRKFAKF
jgi:phage terminase large subunit